MDFCHAEKTVEKICLACRVPPDGGEKVHRMRPSHGIALYVSGKSMYHFEKAAALTVGKNELIYLPQGSNYTVEPLEKCECYAINFQLGTDETFAPCVLPMENNAVEHFKNAENAFSAKKLGYEYACMASLYALFYEMLRVAETEYVYKEKTAVLAPAVEYIHEHFFDGEVSVEALAARCGISTAYLRRLFVGKFGVPPVRYIERLRLERAKELLASGLYAVESACRLSGYRDVSYFCRAFKRETGRTPSEYRAGMR